MDDYDAIIIGTRQSGPSLAKRLVAAGQKVALTGCTVYEGHAQFVGTKKVAVDGVVLHADHTFINAGGRGADSTDPRLGSGSLPHQQLNDGCRFPSPTSHCPGRQLHRPRIRAGLSPLRKRGDGDRTSTAAD